MDFSVVAPEMAVWMWGAGGASQGLEPVVRREG